MVAAVHEIFEQIDTPIGGVPADKVMAVWPRAAKLLKRVVKPHTGFDLDGLLTQIQLANYQLWVIGDFEAVAVTTIHDRPLHRVLWCQFIVGDNVEDWLDDWEKVQAEFAKAQDCVAVEFSGRPGWRKFQDKYRNYKPVLTTYRREL